MNITEITSKFDIQCTAEISGYYSEYIDAWRRIYENSPPWQAVKRGGLYQNKGKRKLLRLNMAKTLCDNMSAMTFAEQCDISVGDADTQQIVTDILEANGFWNNLPDLLSSVFALGGGALKCYLESGMVRIDYIPADRFIPVRWDGKGVTAAIFVSATAKGKDYYTLLEYQHPVTTEERAVQRAEFKLFKSASDKDMGVEVPLSELYPELPTSVEYDTPRPMFAYFKPAVSNNSRYDLPMGMSVFADCLDTLQSLDTVFDSITREFVLGKKRIIVPTDCIRTVVDPETGNSQRYFDPDDEAFVALKTTDMEQLKITDNTAALRVEEHISAINALLNILCMQTGLSAGTFSFDAAQGVKTATEIVSQESKSARTIRTNKNLLTEAIEDIVHAAIFLGTDSAADYTVTVSWKDNIVEDINSVADRAIKLYSAGLISRQKALMDIYGLDEAAALAMIEDINKESDIGGSGLDMFGKTE